jgi:hypothetical protein
VVELCCTKKKLKKITTFVDGVAAGLRELDVLSREDLASRMGSTEIDELVDSLHRLSKEAAVLMGQAQTFGRQRNLAEERWILALADIYENALGQPATVWGAGDCPKDFTISWSLADLRSFQHAVSYILGRSIAFLSKGAHFEAPKEV